jgi:hypothetical protein
MKKILYLIILLLFMISCNRLEKGEIIDKIYEPEEEQLIIMPVITPGPNNTTSITNIPMVQYDGEDYILTIVGIHQGKKRYEKVYVSKQQFNCVRVGDTLVIGKDCSFEDKNNTSTEK